MRIGVAFHEYAPPPDEPWVHVEMGGGGDDAFAAYRRIVTANEQYTLVMVAVPPGALFPGSPLDVRIFKVPGHNFGFVSSVLNWNGTQLCVLVLAFARDISLRPASWTGLWSLPSGSASVTPTAYSHAPSMPVNPRAVPK